MRECSRVIDPGPMAAVGAFVATWMEAPLILQFGGVVVLLGVAELVRPWMHGHQSDTMDGMVAGTAGGLVGAAVGVALRAATGTASGDPGMTLSMLSMAGMIGGTVASGWGRRR